jgi:hypothetical protein
MGFNVFVVGDVEGGACYGKTGIDRGYYVLMANAEMYGDEGVMIEFGRAVGIDLEPFTRFAYEGMPCFDEAGEEVPCEDEAPPENHWLPVAAALETATRFREAVLADPSRLRTIPFGSKEEIGQQKEFIDYFESGEVVKDLGQVIAAIECYRSAGATRIRFTAG